MLTTKKHLMGRLILACFEARSFKFVLTIYNDNKFQTKLNQTYLSLAWPKSIKLNLTYCTLTQPNPTKFSWNQPSWTELKTIKLNQTEQNLAKLSAHVTDLSWTQLV